MSRAGWSAAKYAALRYLVAGVFGLLAGLSLTAINTASDYNSGGSYTLLSVAAVVIGGCSLAGGLISPLGVVAGSVTLSLDRRASRHAQRQFRLQRRGSRRPATDDPGS